MPTGDAERDVREVDVVLRDGSMVHVRPVGTDDEPGMIEFMRGLSEGSRWLRYFSAATDPGTNARRAVNIDYLTSYGAVATTGPDGVIVGYANDSSGSADRAEMAFAIADAFQAHGLVTIMSSVRPRWTRTHPEIAEMDLNPVIALADAAIVVDARVRVEPVSPPPPAPSLRA